MVLIVFVSVFRGVKLEEKTVQCEASWTGCSFKNVTFDQDTKLNIERIGEHETTDKAFDRITFYSSSVSLVHPDILAKFPNINKIVLRDNQNVINNQDKFKNCQNIIELN
jgi:hypothetical protein